MVYDFTAFLGDFVPILVNFLTSAPVWPFVGLGIFSIVVGIFRRLTSI